MKKKESDKWSDSEEIGKLSLEGFAILSGSILIAILLVGVIEELSNHGIIEVLLK